MQILGAALTKAGKEGVLLIEKCGVDLLSVSGGGQKQKVLCEQPHYPSRYWTASFNFAQLCTGYGNYPLSLAHCILYAVEICTLIGEATRPPSSAMPKMVLTTIHHAIGPS